MEEHRVTIFFDRLLSTRRSDRMQWDLIDADTGELSYQVHKRSGIEENQSKTAFKRLCFVFQPGITLNEATKLNFS